MKRLEFIKKTGLATVGLPLLSSFELSKECLFVEDQVEREKFDFKIYAEYDKLGYYVRENGNISAIEISKILNVSARTIERDLKELKEENKIEYVGSRKSGKWIIKE